MKMAIDISRKHFDLHRRELS